MGFESDIFANPFSFILGAASFVGFFIVARNEIRLAFQRLVRKLRAAMNGGVPLPEQDGEKSAPVVRHTPVILGLVLMGLVFSSVILLLHGTVEQSELKIRLEDFLLILLVFTILPGGLVGIAAGAWIDAIYRTYRVDLLERLLTGMLVYIILFTLFELFQIHLLLFLCGPAVTLLVYRFSPV